MKGTNRSHLARKEQRRADTQANLMHRVQMAMNQGVLTEEEAAKYLPVQKTMTKAQRSKRKARRKTQKMARKVNR